MNLRYARVERDGPITTVTLNRPEVLNALHSAAHEELSGIFDDFARDPSQWLAIVTGAGEKAFSAGHDLKDDAAGGAVVLPPSGFGGLTARFDLDKPVIAAVNGLALGGGFEIVLACDIVIAAQHASFGLPEPKVGLAAVAGGLLRLPRAIGLKRAMGMILTSRRVDAAEAMALGFVNEVVPAAALLETAQRIAKQIWEASPMAIRAAKQIVARGLDLSLQEAMTAQMQFPAVLAMLQSEDAKEGPQAFAQKRRPQWRGC